MTINDPDKVAEVKAAFDAYELALISNDVSQLVSFFWDSAFAIRFGVGEQLYGFEAISSFRRNRVVNFSQREPIELRITTFGSYYASVMYEYKVVFDGKSRKGRQSQTWVRFADEWKIVSAHISLAPTENAVETPLKTVGLEAKLEWHARIQANFETTAMLAEELMAFPLPENTEPASVFEP